LFFLFIYFLSLFTVIAIFFCFAAILLLIVRMFFHSLNIATVSKYLCIRETDTPRKNWVLIELYLSAMTTISMIISLSTFGHYCLQEVAQGMLIDIHN
jgi:hypothetical protein